MMSEGDPLIPSCRDGTAKPRVFATQWLAAIREMVGERGESEELLAGESDVSVLNRVAQSNIPATIQLQTLARSLGVTYESDLASLSPSATFLEGFSIAFAREHCVLGVVGENDRLFLAVGSIDSWRLADVVSRHLGRSIEFLFAPPERVQAAINLAYQQRDGRAQTLVDTIDRSDVLPELNRLSQDEDLLDVDDRAPVIKLVNLILFEAVKARASDVHIQPYEERLVVRSRIDGVLFDTIDVPKHLQEEVLSRFKVMGKMNIAEKRLPQDGRATVQVGDRLIDLRIASLPTSHGERVVIRLLDKSARLYTLGELGMPKGILDPFSELIHMEHGLILVTGPTGSGKSTTLYGALQDMDAKNRNVVTLEDPIEYQLDGISQTQINEKKGLSFAKGLRNILRQDPDIIMVGEIRDYETAEMAIQSALTGHMVFSTLHTNDAASAVTRLLDLDVEPYLVASSVVAVLAQRLIRRVCPDCSEPQTPTKDNLRRLRLGPSDPPTRKRPCGAWLRSVSWHRLSGAYRDIRTARRGRACAEPYSVARQCLRHPRVGCLAWDASFARRWTF